MNRISVIGSTGSIGCSALAVVDAHPDRLQVVALAAGENAARLASQVERHRPAVVAMSSEAALSTLKASLSAEMRTAGTAFECGASGLIAVATHPEVNTVLFASSGTASLEAVLAAIQAGKRVALANKEILVMAGGLVMELARARGVDVLPVDSEHNAIHQCLNGRAMHEVRRVILTASGGPFRNLTAGELRAVTPGDALRHPTWNMGPKITVDSATLMNKGLEVIEARWLFNLEPGRIAVVVHPQSIVHSLVEFTDGSILAQLGVTDMRLPIQYALAFPERWPAILPALDLTRTGPLTFEPADTARFPCLDLAFRALSATAASPIVLNAANEIAVAAFLDGKLAFTAIPAVVEAAMERSEAEGSGHVRSLEDVRAVDGWARRVAGAHIAELQWKVL